MKRFSGFVGAALLMIGWQAPAHCAMLTMYDFNDNNNVADFVASNVTAGNFLTGGGLLNISYVGSANARGWNPSSSQSGANTNGDYWTFTVTAASGYQLDLSSLTFDDKRGSNGPVSFEIAVNGTVVGPVGTATTSFASVSYDLSAFTGLTTATIQLFAWNAHDNGVHAQWFVDNVVLNGLVELVPVNPSIATPLPPSFVMLGTGALPLLGTVGLIRRKLFRPAA